MRFMSKLDVHLAIRLGFLVCLISVFFRSDTKVVAIIPSAWTCTSASVMLLTLAWLGNLDKVSAV